MTGQQPTIVFRLNPRSDRAPFRQLVDQVTSALERAQLQPGDRLPSVREVVRQITINPNTVHRAYRELEHLGVVEGRSGLGTFIVETSAIGPGDYQSQSWRDMLREGIEVARSLGLSDDDVLNSLRQMLGSDAEVQP